MSWQATEWVRKTTIGDSKLKLILLMLCNYANDEGESYYSQETIATDTEIPIRTLRRKLEQLESLGFIETIHRIRDDGKRRSSVIRVVMGPAAKMADGLDQRPKSQRPKTPLSDEPSANMVAAVESNHTKNNHTKLSATGFSDLRFAESKPHPAKKRCIIPKSFPMTDRHRKYAAERGLSGSYADNIFENFRNHHAAKGTLMLDWDWAWQTWVGNEVKYNAARMAPKAQQSMVYGDDYQ